MWVRQVWALSPLWTHWRPSVGECTTLEEWGIRRPWSYKWQSSSRFGILWGTLHGNLKRRLPGCRAIIWSQINHVSNLAKNPPRPCRAMIILIIIIQWHCFWDPLLHFLALYCMCVCLACTFRSGRLCLDALFLVVFHDSCRALATLQKINFVCKYLLWYLSLILSHSVNNPTKSTSLFVLSSR